ncbi:7-keto-8-aminopelargonate synthetase-like enzyme [Burkholderia sp. OAS925]
MRDSFLAHLRGTLEQIRADGFYKSERVIDSPQSADIRLADGAEVLNFCANNYLGLANDARLIEAAKQRARQRRLRHGVGAFYLRHADGP